ncbi:MAG: hypothetical protein OXC91_07490 [Rhodobacteraceae bacterium]|nr:hypothetical protein [Paracoccaceae bacterium]
MNRLERDYPGAIESRVEFEIFGHCGDYVNSLAESDEDFNRMTIAGAYNNGTSQAEVLKVYQIELRDWILNQLNEMADL